MASDVSDDRSLVEYSIEELRSLLKSYDAMIRRTTRRRDDLRTRLKRMEAARNI